MNQNYCVENKNDKTFNYGCKFFIRKFGGDYQFKKNKSDT